MTKLRLVHTEGGPGKYRAAFQEALRVSLEDAVAGDAISIPLYTTERNTMFVLDAEDDTKCYGALQYNPKPEEDGFLWVNWAHSSHPKAFAMMASRLRVIVRELGPAVLGIMFATYGPNTRMHKMAKVLNASLVSTCYKVRM